MDVEMFHAGNVQKVGELEWEDPLLLGGAAVLLWLVAGKTGSSRAASFTARSL